MGGTDRIRPKNLTLLARAGEAVPTEQPEEPRHPHPVRGDAMSAHQKWAADLAKIRGVLTAEQQTTRALAEAAGLTIPRTP